MSRCRNTNTTVDWLESHFVPIFCFNALLYAQKRRAPKFKMAHEITIAKVFVTQRDLHKISETYLNRGFRANNIAIMWKRMPGYLFKRQLRQFNVFVAGPQSATRCARTTQPSRRVVSHNLCRNDSSRFTRTAKGWPASSSGSRPPAVARFTKLKFLSVIVFITESGWP